jgi:hypothetical protein
MKTRLTATKFGFILLPDSGKVFVPMADVVQLGL